MGLFEKDNITLRWTNLLEPFSVETAIEFNILPPSWRPSGKLQSYKLGRQQEHYSHLYTTSILICNQS
jgi:ABC-type antimicrobial peptide transport system permease subunit